MDSIGHNKNNNQMTEENILEEYLQEPAKNEDNSKEKNFLGEINYSSFTQGSTQAQSSIRSKNDEEPEEKIEKNKEEKPKRLNLVQGDMQKESKTPIDPSYQETFNYIQQNRGIESNQNEVQQIQEINRDINENENIEDQMELEKEEQVPQLMQQNLVENNNNNHINNEPVNQAPQLIQQNQAEINNIQNNNDNPHYPQIFMHNENLLNTVNNQGNADEILDSNFPALQSNRHQFNLPSNPIFGDPESLSQNEPPMMLDEEAFENHNNNNGIYESFYFDTEPFTQEKENNGNNG